MIMSHTTLARGVSARHTIHVSCACVFDLSSTLSSHSSGRLTHLLLHPPDLSLHLLCGSVRREISCALPRMRSLALWSTTRLSQFPQNSMVGQQRQQISELHFPNPQSFLVWKIRFTNQVTACSDFPSEAMLWIKQVEMVDSLDRDPFLERIFQTSRCWT